MRDAKVDTAWGGSDTVVGDDRSTAAEERGEPAKKIGMESR